MLIGGAGVRDLLRDALLPYSFCLRYVLPSLPLLHLLTSAPIVPRPLFVEEFGLKRLMQQRGTSLELDRSDFEAGRWEFHIAEAHKRGKEEKEESRRVGYVCEGAGRVIVQEIERFLEQRE